jgi:hypothetical protein
MSPPAITQYRVMARSGINVGMKQVYHSTRGLSTAKEIIPRVERTVLNTESTQVF